MKPKRKTLSTDTKAFIIILTITIFLLIASAAAGQNIIPIPDKKKPEACIVIDEKTKCLDAEIDKLIELDKFWKDKGTTLKQRIRLIKETEGKIIPVENLEKFENMTRQYKIKQGIPLESTKT